jgi:predicted TIM-barrel enzyme
VPARGSVPDRPVLANAGVNLDDVAAILEVADGCVSGSHFAIGGDTWTAVDGDRVERFMDRVAKLR